MKAMAASGDVQAASFPKTMIALLNTASRRAKLVGVIIGCSEASPTDTMAKFAIRKITADGTGTTGTPLQVDSADGAPVITARVNYSVEPTYAAGNLAEIDLHMRNTMVWTPPTQDAVPAAALGTANGLGLVMLAGPTSKNYNFTPIWEE
jgi:hypothetical protein